MYDVYRNDLKNREFDKKASQNSHLERATIVRAQGASEEENFEKKPTQLKTDSSGRFGIIVIGGGAAGVFAAISAKAASPSAQVILLEKSGVLLSKVRISGGGRCNVTHSCFDPGKLSTHYPRGEKELIGAFHRFQPRDTIGWFESRGVSLKAESDGRIFPVTDSSETIIQCLLSAAQKLGVEIHLRQHISRIEKQADGFAIHLKEQEPLYTSRLILATGSSPAGYAWAEHLGHTIQPPVPSLFTFNVPTSPLKELSGIALESARVQIQGTSLAQTGPLLITHFGFSGPAVLKLSAWGARYLHEKEYRVEILIDWLPQLSEQAIFAKLSQCKTTLAQKNLLSENPFKLPKKLWESLLGKLAAKRLAHIAIKDLHSLAHKLHANAFQVEGKTTHKEEFVTCGGVHLKEVDFKTLQSKVCPGLYFAGEILDIDGVTGGFNFQNAWTTGFLAGKAAS